MTRVTLPDEPNVFADANSFFDGHYRQRWLPGAFGARDTITGVKRFRVLRDEWYTGPDGVVSRTIIEAEVVE